MHPGRDSTCAATRRLLWTPGSPSIRARTCFLNIYRVCVAPFSVAQLYVAGEFVGGTDIMIEMYKDGSLKSTLDAGGAKFL